MDKISYETRTYEAIKHRFYCDDCGQFIMESIESDDGWYPEPTEFYIQHVKLKGHYCDRCGSRRVDEVLKVSREMGFDI